MFCLFAPVTHNHFIQTVCISLSYTFALLPYNVYPTTHLRNFISEVSILIMLFKSNSHTYIGALVPRFFFLQCPLFHADTSSVPPSSYIVSSMFLIMLKICALNCFTHTLKPLHLDVYVNIYVQCTISKVVKLIYFCLITLLSTTVLP
jgi:hypothetical protein